MSLLPSTLAVMMILLLTFGATQLSHDAALSSAQSDRQQLAMVRNALILQQAADHWVARNNMPVVRDVDANDELDVPSNDERQSSSARDVESQAAQGASAITIEQLNSAESAELSDLPPRIVRITALTYQSQIRVRAQADYAILPCDSDQEAPCPYELRRIAWRRLPD